MGSFFGGGKQTSTSTSDSTPWAKQQPYLTYGFEQGRGAYEDARNAGVYQGDRVADFNGTQADSLRGLAEAGLGGYGTQAGAALMGAGYGSLGSLGSASNNYSSIYTAAGADPTQSTISRAAQYANNPYLQSQIDAAAADITRNSGIQQANFDAAASATGNGSSTRAGLVESENHRNAMDQVGRVSTGMRSAAYDQGLQLAATQQQQGLAAQLAAAGGQASVGQAGAGILGQGYGIGQDALQQALGAGSMQQQQVQNDLDAAQQYHNENRLDGLNLAQQYMGVVGGNYGGTQTSTQTTPKQSPFQTLLGIGLQGASMAGGLGWRPFG